MHIKHISVCMWNVYCTSSGSQPKLSMMARYSHTLQTVIYNWSVFFCQKTYMQTTINLCVAGLSLPHVAIFDANIKFSIWRKTALTASYSDMAVLTWRWKTCSSENSCSYWYNGQIFTLYVTLKERFNLNFSVKTVYLGVCLIFTFLTLNFNLM